MGVCWNSINYNNMKNLLALLFVLFSICGYSATRTLVDAGGTWSVTATWAESAVPTSADDVILPSTVTGTLTINSVAACKSFSVSPSFTSGIIHSSTLTVSGNVTLAAGMTNSGTGDLIINATGTLTSNTQVWSGGYQGITAGTQTFADAWTFTGNCALFSNTTNGTTLTFGGNLTITGGTGGTISLIWNGSGTGTWSGNQNMNQNLEIAGTGTFVISGSVKFAAAKILKFTSAASVVTTGSTIGSIGNSPTFTINMSGITFNILTVTGSGNLTFNGSNGCSFAGAFTNTGSGGQTIFQASNTYTFLSGSSYQLAGTSGFHATFKSSSSSVTSIVTFAAGSTTNITFTNGKWIDSSGGLQVLDTGGTLTSTINWSTGANGNVAIFFQQW